MSIRPLSPELQSVAENELDEVPSRIPNDLKHIRDWIAEQPHLHARTDDQWLLAFLRGCKYNLERTKAKLDLFYTVRSQTTEFFGNRDPFQPEIQELLEYGTCIPLPKSSDPSSKTTLLLRHKTVDPKKIHIAVVLKLILMIDDILIIEDDNFIVPGFITIDDEKGVPLGHFLQMTPNTAKKTMACFQNAYPIRPKQVHILNASSPFEATFKIVQFFMTEKMRSRFRVYGKNYTEELKSFVPSEILPTEYGGDAGPLDVMAAQWKKKVESYRDWFLDDAKYGVDESKRPKKPRTCEIS